MNPKRLLEHYHRIADAEDAVPRLRRFVLDLAVRGKLVEQDPADEPAAELLKRIAVEALVQNSLPKRWRRVTLGNVLDFKYGKGLKASERLEEGPIPVFGSNGIVGYTVEPLTNEPSIIVGRKGSAGALNLCCGPSWITDVAYFVEAPSFFELRYLFLTLASLNLDKLGKGVKPGLSRNDAYLLELIIPPLAEQRRIVTKVDELMALCDQLEAARSERETTRDRLAVTSLARLTAPETGRDDFPAHARFALGALPALTARPSQIKTLRQTILNLAVTGCPIKAKKTETRKIGDLFDIRTGFAFKSNQYTREGTLIFRAKNFKTDGAFDLSDSKYFKTENINGKYSKYLLEENDILMVMVGGSIGKTMQVSKSLLPSLMNQNMWRLTVKNEQLLPTFAYMLIKELNSRNLQKTESTHGHFTQSEYNKEQVTVPSLKEQKLIVTKLDELMALCHRLEAALAAVDSTRARLLESLLCEALAAGEEMEDGA